MKFETVDKALEVLAWVHDRMQYRKACGTAANGGGYASDCMAERDALAYLDSVGYCG